MQALDRARDGMKIVQLNDSERSLNIFLSFSISKWHLLWTYTTFINVLKHLFDPYDNKKNIAINMGRIWRHPVLSQSETVCTVAIMEVQGDTPFSMCIER